MPLLLCNCSRMRRHLHASPPAFVFFCSPLSLLWLEDGAFIHPPFWHFQRIFLLLLLLFCVIGADDGHRATTGNTGLSGVFVLGSWGGERKKRKKKKRKMQMEKKKDCVFDLDVDCRGLFVDQPEAFFLPRGDEIEEGGGENGPWSDAWDATVRDNTKKERKNNNNNNRRFSNHIRIQLPSHPSLRLFF